MNFDPNSLFYYMAKTYSDNKTPDNKITFVNIGGSRSSKTIDAIHLIVAFCLNNTNLSIGCFRNTLKDCREKLYEHDFKKALKDYIGIFDQDNARKENQSPEYILNSNKIVFRGLDEETEQVSYDIVFINEVLEIENEAKIAGLKMRCNKMMIYDCNPSLTIHWIFDYEDRKDVYFTKTTYKNNKHLSKSIVTEIEGYEPTIENVKAGTADKWRWEVYGLGNKSNKDGCVFADVTWHDAITQDCGGYYYGLDFGNTTGTYSLAVGCDNKAGIWFDCPIYGSFADKNEIANDFNSGLKAFFETFKQWLSTWKVIDKTKLLIIADSAQPNKIVDLNLWCERDNVNAVFMPVKKFPGCIDWRIDMIKRRHINLVKRTHIVKEQENYTYMTINGIRLNKPIDDFNHFWDSAGYSIQYQEHLRK